MLQLLQTHNNLLLQISLSLFLTLLLTFLKIPLFFLHDLHPENRQHIGAAIGRPPMALMGASLYHPEPILSSKVEINLRRSSSSLTTMP
ncbi:hypothetical protein SLEP1_g3503 [Rubroshorea leprosula]|uniref:Uncharacterized protein n=1 Tax=Rubroshorea leprosula TaxID=152421 RepID=A0AAV5HT74_9ROSI|nr:hypothetical protein SLEP1_g3503 [Rubroshorea leprosula]